MKRNEIGSGTLFTFNPVSTEPDVYLAIDRSTQSEEAYHNSWGKPTALLVDDMLCISYDGRVFKSRHDSPCQLSAMAPDDTRRNSYLYAYSKRFNIQVFGPEQHLATVSRSEMPSGALFTHDNLRVLLLAIEPDDDAKLLYNNLYNANLASEWLPCIDINGHMFTDLKTSVVRPSPPDEKTKEKMLSAYHKKLAELKGPSQPHAEATGSKQLELKDIPLHSFFCMDAIDSNEESRLYLSIERNRETEIAYNIAYGRPLPKDMMLCLDNRGYPCSCFRTFKYVVLPRDDAWQGRKDRFLKAYMERFGIQNQTYDRHIGGWPRNKISCHTLVCSDMSNIHDDKSVYLAIDRNKDTEIAYFLSNGRTPPDGAEFVTTLTGLVHDVSPHDDFFVIHADYSRKQRFIDAFAERFTKKVREFKEAKEKNVLERLFQDQREYQKRETLKASKESSERDNKAVRKRLDLAMTVQASDKSATDLRRNTYRDVGTHLDSILSEEFDAMSEVKFLNEKGWGENDKNQDSTVAALTELHSFLDAWKKKHATMLAHFRST